MSDDASKNSSWLSDYYHRIQSDCVTSFERRDRVTNWSYTILAVVIAAYAGFFADGTFVTPLGRFGLVAGALFVLIRFFFTSMIAYVYFLRARYFRTRIEQYWMDGTPTIDEIKKDIKEYDHGKSQPKTGRNPFMGQVKSGFFLILIIPLAPLAIEFYIGMKLEYFAIIGALIIYILFERYNFKNYDQVQPSQK
ncbi:MAG: hypothetical protein K5798_08285 [Nitrosopumilus sp.]|uniref:hypothetical protein n=1 Tax=Nitrosopumilus sp. TaxID=2024843 RepID=UPI0024308A0F|nr:hypothetical protein [Nitrosopumilus sp.]MCV0367240.1 hypothetical protein [Nitrosopumilus sp.]